eukprot:TRINITY_DN7748_c0_g1_i1.p1 TRINITY_DN7748_c0_g1~~TRINITY_DN7748_c0_g1_i1.p1  ORF type:complete len:638 (-),score=104.34 TRINITY_DN7748_c0_g1_i1:125-2038(-)
MEGGSTEPAVLGKWRYQASLNERGDLVVTATELETSASLTQSFSLSSSSKDSAAKTLVKKKDIVDEVLPQKENNEKVNSEGSSATAEPAYKAFNVRKKPIRHAFTNEIVDYENIVEFTDHSMIAYIKPYTPSEGLYKTPPRARADELFQARDQLRAYSTPAMIELLKFLDSQYAELAKKLDAMIKDENVISYKSLWYLFPKGHKVYGTTDDGHKVGAEVVSTLYMAGIFPCFELTGSVIKANGKHFYTTSHKFRILPFAGTKPIPELTIKLLDQEDEVKQELIARGARFAQMGVGVHYKTYQGYLSQREGWWGFQLYKATGRVILDGISFNRTNPNSRSSPHSAGHTDRYNEQSNSFPEVPEEKFFMTWPTILGFSFSAKKWGELVVSDLGDIVFDDLAYDRLVLPQEKKVLIKALVENCDNTFSDIISGKGGGCIFLLHGSPGVGKTLTAESIAELLHRPLYSVSVGELGTDTIQLEKRLREILEVSSSWNAVILLDEADIFLEKRSENDIARNAMVGIFLRLLEYHQGVLFLTTNRVRSFDKAFHSRISIALRYEDLTSSAREQVWNTMLSAAGIEGMDAKELGKYDLNGRQIRTICRLALSLAKSEDVTVNKTHLERTILIADQFQTDIISIET